MKKIWSPDSKPSRFRVSFIFFLSLRRVRKNRPRRAQDDDDRRHTTEREREREREILHTFFSFVAEKLPLWNRKTNPFYFRHPKQELGIRPHPPKSPPPSMRYPEARTDAGSTQPPVKGGTNVNNDEVPTGSVNTLNTSTIKATDSVSPSINDEEALHANTTDTNTSKSELETANGFPVLAENLCVTEDKFEVDEECPAKNETKKRDAKPRTNVARGDKPGAIAVFQEGRVEPRSGARGEGDVEQDVIQGVDQQQGHVPEPIEATTFALPTALPAELVPPATGGSKSEVYVAEAISKNDKGERTKAPLVIALIGLMVLVLAAAIIPSVILVKKNHSRPTSAEQAANFRSSNSTQYDIPCGNGTEGNGICPNGTCCSPYFFCGTTPEYCGSGSSCSNEYGNDTRPCNLTEFSCGNGKRGNGFCMDGSCCSEFGYCGNTSAYCNVSGIPCGNGVRGNGTCLDGSCCSNYGYCGNTTAYCGSSDNVTAIMPSLGYCGNGTRGNGTCAQAEYCCSQDGYCDTTCSGNFSFFGTCGGGVQGNGICPDGSCCSQYFYCGTTSDYCGAGSTCVNNYGNGTQPCNMTDIPCGNGFRGNGICSNGECCSQYGYCGTSAAYCSGN